MRIKTVAAALLQLLLAVVSRGNASALRRCGVNKFYDNVAQICTNCDDICNPLRGTPYLCEQYSNECSNRECIAICYYSL